MPERPLLVIAGPTASGKTSLALELAKHLPIEVISADSRQVYRGLGRRHGQAHAGRAATCASPRT